MVAGIRACKPCQATSVLDPFGSRPGQVFQLPRHRKSDRLVGWDVKTSGLIGVALRIPTTYPLMRSDHSSAFTFSISHSRAKTLTHSLTRAFQQIACMQVGRCKWRLGRRQGNMDNAITDEQAGVETTSNSGS